MSDPQTKPDELAGTEAPFVSHLVELRDRASGDSVDVPVGEIADRLVALVSA